MFHAINAWLARRLRQIVDIGLADDNAIAVAHGWNAQQVKPGTWSYRDPRFIYRSFDRTHGSTGCASCDDKIAEWFHFSGDLGISKQAVQARRWF
jgi:hypothetical protein